MTPPKIKVFVDSDVIISSLISNRGAAFILLHDQPQLSLIFSATQPEELNRVAKRLKLNLNKLNQLINLKLKMAKSKKLHFTGAEKLVIDPDDRHIAAGLIASKPRFFISYNLKHFRTEKIKTELQRDSSLEEEVAQLRALLK